MQPDQARDLVMSLLGQIAPELRSVAIDPDAELQVEADLDSIDYLSLVEGLSEALHHQIPERDYTRLVTLADFVRYASSHGEHPES